MKISGTCKFNAIVIKSSNDKSLWLSMRRTPHWSNAEIKKIVKISHTVLAFTALWVNPHVARHTQSLISSLYVWPQNCWSFFEHEKKGEKRQCDQFFHSTSNFFDHCFLCFFFDTVTDGVGHFVDHETYKSFCSDHWHY